METIPFPPLRSFAVTTSNPRVDATKGIIFGVSLITSGLIAKGHDLEVDQTTLEQMLSCAQEKKKLPVKWNHKTGADAVSGYLKNFRIEDKKLVGDWHLLKSHERYAHAIELATEMPECLGLSTSFRGEDQVVGEKKFARCTDLVSADLVASPAANPDGFFEEREAPSVDSPASGMAKPSTTTGAAETPAKEFTIADVMAGITALNGRLAGVEERVTNFESALQEQELEEHEFEEQEEEVTDFANGAEALQYLQERLAAIEDEKEQSKIDHAFEVYESKVEQLIELNEQLALENAAMAEAITEFSTKTGGTVTFSASPDGGGYTHSLSVPDADDERPAARTEFEALCRQFEADGKDEHEAIRLAIGKSPKAYTKHLQEIGVIARNL